MAGVKHFYIGTYEEGVSPGDPSEWGADIYAVQQKFYLYFSTQQEETDCEIIACTDIVLNDYGFQLGGKPTHPDYRVKWSDIPQYCDNLKYTSDKFLAGTGVRRIRQTDATVITLCVGAVGRLYQRYNPVIIEGFSIEHNEGSTTYGDKSTIYFYMGYSDTTGLANQHIAPVIFKNCRISKTTSYTGHPVSIDDIQYHVTTPDGTACLQFIDCVIYTWSAQAVNIYRYCNTNPACAFVNCYIYGNSNAYTFSSTWGNATFGYDKKMFGIFNCLIDHNHGGYYGLLTTNHNCDVYNTIFLNAQWTDRWIDRVGFNYSKPSNPAPTQYPVVKNCGFMATTANKCVTNSNVVQENNKIGLKIYTALTNGDLASDATYGAPVTNKDFWDISGAYSNTPHVNFNGHLLLQGSPTIDGKTKDAGTMEVWEVMKTYFSSPYPNFSLFSNDLAYGRWGGVYTGDSEYKRVRGSSIDIGCFEYIPYQIELSVSPEYTSQDEGFGTLKFNTIESAIDSYLQTHQGIDYTGCKIVVEQDMEVPQIKFNDDRLISASTQMFVICGRRSEPYVDNPQIKLTCSGASMFEFESNGEGSIPDGLEFRDIEFIGSGVSNVIKVGDDSTTKLLFQRCKFTATGKNTTQAFISGTLNGSYPQNSPSRIIVNNCAFEGKAVDFKTDGSGSNIAFVNTTFMGNKTGKTAEVSVTSSVQRFINCGFWRCEKPVDGTFEMINTWLFNCPEQDWKAASKLTNCATDLSSFGQATASNCKYDLNPDEQFHSYGKYGLLKFFPKEGSDLTTGATTDVLKDFSIYVYGGLAPEQYDPIGTGRPLR